MSEKKYKFVARVNLQGDFDLDDGFGEDRQEVAAGKVASTGDKKLYDSMLEQGYIKPYKKGAEDEEEDEAPSLSTDDSKAPEVKSTDKVAKTARNK